MSPELEDIQYQLHNVTYMSLNMFKENKKNICYQRMWSKYSGLDSHIYPVKLFIVVFRAIKNWASIFV